MTYTVFVDGPRDRSPQAIARVAAAMAQRYGLPAADLETRLARGRFKVKANVDRATAEEYARDLERLGARCVVLDGSGATVAMGATLPRPTTPAPLPAKPRPASQPSGLAAARANASQDLGALGRDDGSIALSALDGSEQTATIEPTSLLPASFGPAPARAPTPAPSRAPTPAPVAKRDLAGREDLFTPPDQAEEEADLDLAVDLVAERARKTPTSMPVVTATPHAPTGGANRAVPPLGAPAGAVDAAAVPAKPGIGALFRDARARLAAGVFLAVLLAFLPAHLVARSREKSAYAAIDTSLAKAYAAADTPDLHAALGKTRAQALDDKYSARKSIALTSLAIWAVLGGALAFAWFRLVPWKRIT
jgi:hypothetical protein